MESKSGENKKKAGRKTIYTVMYLVCIVVFIFAAYKVVDGIYGYIKTEKLYEKTQSEFVKVEQDDTPEPVIGPIYVDFKGLTEINDDVIGWIYMEDTVVSYPILQSTNNQYYLDRTLYEGFLPSGSIFADYRNSSSFTDSHTVIYGHNMKNHTMFGDMDMFMDEEYYKEHPYIYIYLASGECYKYEIYSAYTAEVDDGTFGIQAEGGASFNDFLNVSINKSIYKGMTGQDKLPGGDDKVITLSTCTEDSDDYRRFVVHAVFKEELKENDHDDTEKAA